MYMSCMLLSSLGIGLMKGLAIVSPAASYRNCSASQSSMLIPAFALGLFNYLRRHIEIVLKPDTDKDRQTTWPGGNWGR